MCMLGIRTVSNNSEVLPHGPHNVYIPCNLLVQTLVELGIYLIFVSPTDNMMEAQSHGSFVSRNSWAYQLNHWKFIIIIIIILDRLANAIVRLRMQTLEI